MKGPFEVSFPSMEDSLIIQPVDKSRDFILFIPLDGLPPDLGYNPVVESLVG